MTVAVQPQANVTDSPRFGGGHSTQRIPTKLIPGTLVPIHLAIDDRRMRGILVRRGQAATLERGHVCPFR